MKAEEMSKKIEGIMELPEEKFRRHVGVKQETFYKMVEVLDEAHEKQKQATRRRAGKKPTFSSAGRLLLAFRYWRHYDTYAAVGIEFGLCESATYDNVKWVENALRDSGRFDISNKADELGASGTIEIAIIDATETPIERPQKNQQEYYSYGIRDLISRNRQYKIS